jgi:hypothetical protein
LAVTVALLTSVLLRRGLDRGAAALFLAAFATYTGLQYYGIDNILR